MIRFNDETQCFERVYAVDPEECSVDELYELRCELSEIVLRKEITHKKTLNLNAPKVVLEAQARQISELKKTLKLLDAFIFRRSLSPEDRLLNAIFSEEPHGQFTKDEK